MSALDLTGFNSPNGFIIKDWDVAPFNYSSKKCYGQAIALQTDGKIVMTGKVENNTPGINKFEIGLVRFLSTGILDPTFGIGGLNAFLLNDSFNNPSDVEVNGITLQLDGKIVVCGNIFSSLSFYEIFVARFLVNGTLDPTFGIGGYTLITKIDFTTAFPLVSWNSCQALSVQIDSSSGNDKIVICGYANCNVAATNKNRIILARLLVNGALDTSSFGTNGLVQSVPSVITYNEYARSLAVSNGGDYYICGTQNTIILPEQFIIGKFNNSGTPDIGFGTSGLVVVSNFFPGSNDGANSIIIQQDGNIVAAGTSTKQITNDECFAVCRLNPTTGALDSSFGLGGKVVSDLSSLSPIVYLNGHSIQQQSDGKLVLGGFWKTPFTPTFNAEESFAVNRLNPNGSIDLSFGINGNGFILEDLVPGTLKEEGLSLIIQPNGQILLAGIFGEMSDLSDQRFFILARYFGFPPFPPPPVPPLPVPVVPICFPAGTPVLTDQGYIPIEQIEPELNTIRNKTIVAITKTITNNDKIVCFEKHSLGYNIPNQRTIVSLNHGIIYNKKLIPARKFVGRKNGVYFKKYNGEYLYNVLMEKHMGMLVNGMKVETLDPKNIVAKLYTNKYSHEQKEKIILQINNYSQHHYNKYSNFNNYERLQYNRTRRNYEVHRFNPILGKLHLRTQKNYSFLNNVVKEASRNTNYHNQTIRRRLPLIKNNSMIKINTNALHRFTRYGRRRR